MLLAAIPPVNAPAKNNFHACFPSIKIACLCESNMHAHSRAVEPAGTPLLTSLGFRAPSALLHSTEEKKREKEGTALRERFVDRLFSLIRACSWRLRLCRGRWNSWKRRALMMRNSESRRKLFSNRCCGVQRVLAHQPSNPAGTPIDLIFRSPAASHLCPVTLCIVMTTFGESEKQSLV